MNVLFLMILPVDPLENPNLYTDLMLEFQQQGHQVYAADIREKRHGKETELVNISGIQVLHIKTGNLFSVGAIEKGLTTLSLKGKFLREIRKKWSDITFDMVIMPTPPITFAGVMDYIKKRDHAKSYLILRDIFPQNAKDLGLIKNELIYKYFRKKEKYMYLTADHIGCMSQGNIDYVLRHNQEVDASKLELLPNWSNVNEAGSDSNHVDYKAKYSLKDKFVCIFGGNIGWPQELEFLIELAKEYKNQEGLVFLIIGKGVLAHRIRKSIEENQLTNVIMIDFMSREDYDGLVSQCQVGLINLDRRFTIPNIPSKTLGYFNAEIPILASIDANTDYGKILDDAKAGLWSITGDLDSYKRNLEFYLNNEDKRIKMGKNGKKYLKEHLTTYHAYSTIMKHI